MKKWETPVLSVLHRSTSAEKVLVYCKMQYCNPFQPVSSYATLCVMTTTQLCAYCYAHTMS
jgi:hypothetical protein